MKKMIFIVVAPIVLLAFFVAIIWGRVTEAERGVLSRRPDHGTCFTLLLDSTSTTETNRSEELHNALARRLASFGTQLFWEPLGSNQVRAYVPVSNGEATSSIASLFSAPGKMDLSLVHTNSRALIERAEVPEGYQLLTNAPSSVSGKVVPQSYLVKRTPGDSEIRFRQAYLSKDSLTGNFEIGFKLETESAEAFRKITRENVGRQLAIIMDGVILSAPVIRSEIGGGMGVISGDFDRIKAAEMASEMQTPLPAKVTIIDMREF